MLELEAPQFPALLPLFQAMDFHLATQSILAGRTGGRAWVDRLEDPRCALLEHFPRFYLAGNPGDAAFNGALTAAFFEQTNPSGRPAELFLVYPDRAEWQAVLAGQFHGLKSLAFERQYYETDARPVEWADRLPAGFTLRQVDADLLISGIAGLDDLSEEMCSERDSVQEFLEKSFGVCPIYQDRLAGWCLSEYNLDERCEIGIASLPPFQRLGLATASTLAFVDLAYRRGIRRIGWHCYTSNRPSVATARRAGLHKVHDYAATITWFHE
jgi:hypothetical protein